jgi:hypothetical protein
MTALSQIDDAFLETLDKENRIGSREIFRLARYARGKGVENLESIRRALAAYSPEFLEARAGADRRIKELFQAYGVGRAPVAAPGDKPSRRRGPPHAAYDAPPTPAVWSPPVAPLLAPSTRGEAWDGVVDRVGAQAHRRVRSRYGDELC